MRRMTSALIGALVALVGLYGAVAIGMFALQRSLIYRPDAERVAPETLGLAGVREIELATPDGAQLVAWRAEAAPGRRTLLYFHGNGGNLAGRAERVRLYRQAGLGLLMPSWRSYSGSTGSPTEVANVADAQLAYDRLVGEGVPARQVVLYGESLGSGVAVQIAARNPVGGVILDAPYTALVDVAAAAYPWLPVRLLLLDRYQSLPLIDRVGAPLLILHGVRDRIVPVEMGRALLAAAREPKRLVEFAEAGHLDHTRLGSVRVITDFLDTLPPAPQRQ